MREVFCTCAVSQHHQGGVCRQRYELDRLQGKGKVRLCPDCRSHWRAEQMRDRNRRAAKPRGECGHEVSKWGVKLCRDCYDPHAPRGTYDKTDSTAGLVASAVERLGPSASVQAVAKRAGVSWSAAKRYLTQENPGRRKRRVTLPEHDGVGTMSGFRQHVKTGETPCLLCRKAYNRYYRERARARKAGEGRQAKRPACGTVGGYGAHRHRGETPCDACRAVHNEYQRAYRARRRDADSPIIGECGHPVSRQGVKRCVPCSQVARRRAIEHGTFAGYQKHRARGEQPCAECRAASAKAAADYAESRGLIGECGHPIKNARSRRCLECSVEARRKPIAHGTTAGYKQHRQRGEDACEACKKAAAERQRRRRAAAA